MDHAVEHSPNGSSGHEHREASVRLILLSAAGLSAVVLVVFLLMWGTFNMMKTKQAEMRNVDVSPMGERFQVPPEPRVEEHPWEQLLVLRARENKILSTYGWQDQKSGIVRIPIDRAMEMMAQKGFPVQQPGQPVAVVKPAPAAAQAKPAGRVPAPGVLNAK